MTLNQYNESELNRLALKFTAVKAIQQQRVTRSAWPRKQFLLAYNSNDERVTAAQYKEGISALYGVTTRSRSGDEGLGNFDVFSHYVGIAIFNL